jgi:hypothetical protein
LRREKINGKDVTEYIPFFNRKVLKEEMRDKDIKLALDNLWLKRFKYFNY